MFEEVEDIYWGSEWLGTTVMVIIGGLLPAVQMGLYVNPEGLMEIQIHYCLPKIYVKHLLNE
jgi:catalase (peroxidase I)